MTNSDHSSKDSRRPIRLTEVFEGYDRDWTEYASCTGAEPDIFFPTFDGGRFQGKNHRQVIEMQRDSAREALNICLICPVRFKCEEQHKHEKDGVFYGTVPAERYYRYSVKPEGCECIPCKIGKVRKRGPQANVR